MTIGFPTNTVSLIIAVMIGAGSGTWFILSQSLPKVPINPDIRRKWRWGIAFVLSVWFLSYLAFAVNNLGAPFVITFLGLGMLAGIAPLLISPLFRQIVHAVPGTWLIGLQALRIGGILFLILMEMKLLPAEFALPAGYGDIAVGLLAFGMVFLHAKRKPNLHALAIGWNVLGLLDFVVALTMGILYIGPFVAQLAASGYPTLYLNYVLIVPSFGVPLYAVLHVYSLYQILSKRSHKWIGTLHVPERQGNIEADQTTTIFGTSDKELHQ